MDIRRLGLGALRECDLLVSCLDSKTGRAAVNGIATRLGIPWVDGALDGAGRSMFARVAAYDPRSLGGVATCVLMTPRLSGRCSRRRRAARGVRRRPWPFPLSAVRLPRFRSSGV